MAITQTSLTAAITATGHTLALTSGTGFPPVGSPVGSPAYVVRIDKELMLCNQQPVAAVAKVLMRGYAGTVAAAHDVLAKVEVSATPADFSNPSAGNSVALPPYLPSQRTLGQDVTFSAADIAALGTQPIQFSITKATAAAIVLVAPSKAQDGLTVSFTNLTDAIHVITATTLLASSGSGSPYTTATWANAKAGGGITLQAENGLWNVVNSLNVTLT